MLDYSGITAALKPAVKVALRVTSSYYDPEVEAVVAGALADLSRMGVAEECFEPGSEFYPLVAQAVAVYAKAHFGQDNPNEEMHFWMESYLMHVDALLNSAANAYSDTVREASVPTGSTGSTGSTGATGSTGSTGATS